jgi:hypothetical protein
VETHSWHLASYSGSRPNEVRACPSFDKIAHILLPQISLEAPNKLRKRYSQGNADSPNLNEIKPYRAPIALAHKGLAQPKSLSQLYLRDIGLEPDFPKRLGKNAIFVTRRLFSHGDCLT